MSKFNKETFKKLEKWCDDNDTQFSRFSCEEKNGRITVYRYDGNGMPGKVQSFISNEEIEKFLNEYEGNEKMLSDYAADIEKEMMID